MIPLFFYYATFYLIVQRMDGLVWFIESSLDSLLSMQMSDSVNGTISGYTTDSILTYRLYVLFLSPFHLSYRFLILKVLFPIRLRSEAILWT